jgi:Asp-tRNA(Asn)/Glu-tRNA(Gln) amidotransferase A subunit family amidase
LDGLDALHLPLQPHAAARRDDSLRLTKKGLPVGLHIVGPRYADALVLRAARAFESVHPIRMPELTIP